MSLLGVGASAAGDAMEEVGALLALRSSGDGLRRCFLDFSIDGIIFLSSLVGDLCVVLDVDAVSLFFALKHCEHMLLKASFPKNPQPPVQRVGVFEGLIAGVAAAVAVTGLGLLSVLLLLLLLLLLVFSIILFVKERKEEMKIKLGTN